MKKILSIFLILVLMVSLAPQTKAANVDFKDVPKSHPYYADIMFLLDKGVISSGTNFGVKNKVTREEVAVMVAKAVGLDGKKTKTKFRDVPESRNSSGYINSAVNAGIINGYPDGTFKPSNLVTRGHMAAFIANAFKLTGQADINFKDVAKGSTSYIAVKKLAYSNITSGYPDGTFKPNQSLTKAHISAFLARAIRNQENPSINKPVVNDPIKQPVANGTGSLKGSVTWQYNKFVGTKADVGSEVFLIPVGFKHTDYTESQLDLYSMIGSIPKKSNLHYAKVNGFGSYEITDIPVGKYSIIISSKNTNRNMNDPIYLKSVLEPILGSTSYETFRLFNLGYRQHEWSTIEIKKDKTIDYSHDFGNTYF